MHITRKLKEEVCLLNPDKGYGVVIMDKKDYSESINHFFSERTKFKIIKEDPTSSRMRALQNYIRKLKKQGQINDAEQQNTLPEKCEN